MENIIFWRHQLPGALYSVGKNNSTRVDEGKKCSSILAIKTNARTVRSGEGVEESCLFSDSGLSELRLGTRRRRKSANYLASELSGPVSDRCPVVKQQLCLFACCTSLPSTVRCGIHLVSPQARSTKQRQLLLLSK